jgi:hypothetical protein
MVRFAAGGAAELGGGSLGLELVAAVTARADQKSTAVLELRLNIGDDYGNVGCWPSSAFGCKSVVDSLLMSAFRAVAQ